jgi:hypothetical protein
MSHPGHFDSEAAWPGFRSLGNYFPCDDIEGLRFLLQSRAHLPDSGYLEVGAFTGTTAKLASEAGFQRILCVDTWSGGSDPQDWINELYHERGELIHETFLKNTAGTCALPMRAASLDAAKRVPDKSLDVIFLDGDHSYEATKADIQAWLPKLRAGGILCGHDFGVATFPGVEQAVRESFPRIFRFGTVWIVFAGTE